MNTHKKDLILYQAKSGKVPFEEWLSGLKDRKARAVIRVRLDRLEMGNAGKCESLGDGVHELKIFFGPGYRVYFGLDGLTLVILLCGGDKSSQKSDIDKAKTYWTDYKERHHETIS